MVPLLLAWSWEPSVVIGLLVIEAAYVYGLLRLRPRTLWDRYIVTKSEVAMFTGGVLLTALALMSPMDTIGDRYLFSMHMVQHLILLMLVPPLLLKGMPAWLVDPILQVPGVGATVRFLTGPIVATVFYGLIIIFWHTTYFFDLTLTNQNVHVVEHLTFIAAGLVMWWPVYSPSRILPRLHYGAQMLYLFAQSLVPAIVGAVITFSSVVIYAPYATAPRLWGISPLEDQQMAGLLMKILGGLVLWVVVTIQFFHWFNQEEHEVERTSDA